MTFAQQIISTTMAAFLSFATASLLPSVASGQSALLTFEDVKRISPSANDEFARALADASAEFNEAGLNTRLRMAHFVAQVMTETGGLKRLDENMNYSYSTLMRVFSRRTVSAAKARELGNLPTQNNVRARAVANWVYGERLGNLGRQTDDGWNFRGSGYIQLTGRYNFNKRTTEIKRAFAERGEQFSFDLEQTPDLVRQPDIGLLAAIAYWQAAECNGPADNHDRYRVRVCVNGEAAHGYEQSKVWFNRAWLRVFRDKDALGFEGAITLAEGIEAEISEDDLFEEILENSGVFSQDSAGTEAGAEQRIEALKEFQRELGLDETGVLDEATKDALLDPREWRYLDGPSIGEPVNITEAETSVSFFLASDTGIEADGIALMPSEGSGTLVTDPNIMSDVADALADATGVYAEYEMGGRFVERKTHVPFSVICDEDDDPANCDTRVAVVDTTLFPQRAVVQILFDTENGKGLCSGTMVSADTVLTAAHCIHSGTTNGRRYSNFQVLPGRNLGALPFGECKVRRAHVLLDWITASTELDARDYDLGALKLDCDVGNDTGYFGVAVPDAAQVGETIIVHGYASDRAPFGRQWVSEDELRLLWELKGFHKADTFGGTSGSPVYMASDDRTLIGVHTNGIHGTEQPWSSHNAFTAITPTRKKLIDAWIGE